MAEEKRALKVDDQFSNKYAVFQLSMSFQLELGNLAKNLPRRKGTRAQIIGHRIKAEASWDTVLVI